MAAVGQGRLIRLYDDLFGQFNQPVAQVLLTKNDLADASRIQEREKQRDIQTTVDNNSPVWIRGHNT